MARAINKLSAREVATLKAVGRYSDGGGLYLVIAKDGGRKWVFRFTLRGRSTDMGLGAVLNVPLAKARQRAAEARALLADGKNPISERRAQNAVPSFGEMADRVVADMAPQWRNEKHAAQWQATLERDAAKLRPVLVSEVQTADVLRVLKPIWLEKPETASRVRGRIERVLDAAKAKGYRTGENPARWRGHLDHLLPKRQKLTRGHHAAMTFEKVPDFIADLRTRDAVAAMALEFTILTAARSGEVRGATWGEIDLEAKVWTVPAVRMKAGRDHRVPLTDRAVQILKQAAPLSTGEAGAVVFPGVQSGKALSDAAFSALLKRMGYAAGEITPHGFRSSFRDWAGEVSSFPRELAEAALAHVVGDETERAYRRGDALEKRRAMMEAWGRYCEPEKAESVVVRLR
ncbi:integrase arm-type DNA-binding domain-containing protein [Brevundimonas sp.]|uniref:tyrosine-type recombinase/integrase n=2 Tax=Brevundimonas sp. TaxID=1871086 RepID=UPI002FC6E393